MTKNAFANATPPDGYRFIDKNDINASEIITLRESINWKGDTLERWKICIDQSLAVVGVRDSNSKLIGMACLVGNVRHAILCDLAVNPAHQHKGIGAAIMSELLKTADSNDVSYLYAELANANPFRDSMIQSGFKATGDSLFRDSAT
jgi:N-acetylglutamate synthase-like GNAT family acetyltransferase